ncbi:MAG: D-alanyl-D-alanine carboxypeptidase family protein [Candidatus Woesearchaeota archaeon]|jgi:D-alanyl-D-alanine dipeptidase
MTKQKTISKLTLNLGGKKGLLEDFMTFFFVAIIVIVILGIILFIIYGNMEKKQKQAVMDLNVIEGFYNTRIILNSEVRPNYKVYDLSIYAVNTGDYETFKKEIVSVIQKFYPNGKLYEKWRILINDKCYIIDNSGVTSSTGTVAAPGNSGVAGVRVQPYTFDDCDTDIIDLLPKVTIPNPEGGNILVLFKPYSKLDEEQGRIFGYRAGQLEGYMVDSSTTGGLESLQNIPKVTCVARSASATNCERMCVASPALVQALKLAASNLKSDERIEISQSYRTQEMQQCLFELNCNKDGNKKCDDKIETPTCNPATSLGCPHMVAGAIDITMFKNNKEMNSEYSSELDKDYVEKFMCQYGFVRYNKEPWHFEYGTDIWELTTQKRAGGKEPCTY